MPAFARLPEHGLLICGLALTRVIGWGSIFYAPSVLPTFVEPGLGLGTAVIFGGITILLVTAAILAPIVGRRIDRHGTRLFMSTGAAICALGLGLLSAAQGPVSYLASWVVIGLGHSLTLGNVDNVTVAQLMGPRTRRVIGLMMLGTGLASGIFWPLAAGLCASFGWRATWLVFAAMQLFIVLPIHLAIPARPPFGGGAIEPRTIAEASAGEPDEEGRVAPGERRAVFWLVAASFSASGIVSWGLPLHLIHLLQSGGLSAATAVAIAALSGPATLLARLVDVVAGERWPAERVAIAGFLLGPLACLILAFAPGSASVATLFVVLFSAAMGVISIARATLPLVLFGRRHFGCMLGRLAFPQNLAFAASPLLFALLMAWWGPFASLLFSAAIQGAACLAMLALVRRINRP